MQAKPPSPPDVRGDGLLHNPFANERFVPERVLRLLRTLLVVPAVVVLCGSLGCSEDNGRPTRGPDRILLEARTGPGWSPARPARLVKATGYRDGAETRARFALADSLERPFQVDLLIEVNPLPVLIAGRWIAEGPPESRSGAIEADELHFLGGQGGLPSLGGRLRLLDLAGEAQFQLVLPPIQLEPIRPGSLGPATP